MAKDMDRKWICSECSVYTYECVPAIDPNCPYHLTEIRKRIHWGDMDGKVPQKSSVSWTFTPDGYVIEGYPN